MRKKISLCYATAPQIAHKLVVAWEPLPIPIYHSWESIRQLFIEMLFVDETAIVA